MTNIHTIAAAIALSLASAAACDPADATAGNAELAAAQEIIAVEHLAEQSFDAGDIDVHMGLWAEGAIEFTSPFGSFTAADEYEAWLAGFFDYTQQMGGTRHHVINPIVQLTDDGAEVTAYLHVVNRGDGSFMGSSVIRDRLVETPEGWRFTARSVEPDQKVP
ncbi:MAG: nuclear transport factor 2 family protein [Myxococcales bacterium]|nr:nuclear transport factor 2 family protein [Myxococcales bacterium]